MLTAVTPEIQVKTLFVSAAYHIYMGDTVFYLGGYTFNKAIT